MSVLAESHTQETEVQGADMSNYVASVQDVNLPLAASIITHRVLHIVASWQSGLHHTVHAPQLPADIGHN